MKDIKTTQSKPVEGASDQRDEQNAADKKTTKSQRQRRTLVASIAAVGATSLPTQWKKPVVDHVLLPAHATTSVASNTSPLTGTAIRTVSGSITCEYTEFVYNAATFTQSTGTASTYYHFSVEYGEIYQSACTDPLGNVTSSSFSSVFGTFNDSYESASDYYPTFVSAVDSSGSYNTDGGVFSETITVTL